MNISTQTSPVEIQALPANGMVFRCRLSGPAQGEPVILLHGFPETSHMWEPVMISLAAEGYRCLAPDQRGYSAGARPAQLNHYQIDQIASDIVALADHQGWQKFHLVGHDWGAGCGWTVVTLYPERISSWTALSIPHMAAFDRAKKTDADQKQRSWYMDAFQLPVIPEQVFGLAIAMNRQSVWKYSSSAEIADYSTVFDDFNGRNAAINWYRANKTLPVTYGEVSLPTLLIWGTQDPVIGRAGVELTNSYMKGEYRLIELEAGHTLVQEKFQQVNQAILDQIRKHPIAS